MRSPRVVVPIVLALVLATLAFSAGPSGMKAVSLPGESHVWTDQALPAAAATPTPVPTPTPEAGSSIIESAMAALQNLDSYRTTLRAEWDGTTSDGKPSKGYLDVKTAYVREPLAYRMDMEGQGFESENQAIMKYTFIQVGDKAWYYDSSTDKWTQMPATTMNVEEGFFMSPKDILSEFNITEGHRSPGTQTVNNIECYQYLFSEKDLKSSSGNEELTRAEGEAYVAVDGGYLVHFTLQGEMSGTGTAQESLIAQGTMQVVFNLSEVNQPITIEPPPEALEQAKGREDIPMLPDAKVEFSTPQFISYSTASSVMEAGNFYEEEMPKKGWKGDATNEVSEDATYLNYTKAADSAMIMITKGDQEQTSVQISISSSQETPEVNRTPEVTVEVATPKVTEEIVTPEATEEIVTPEVTEEVVTPEVTEEIVTPEVTETPEAQMREDIPLAADAEVDYASPEFTSYRTNQTVQETADFYETEMPNNDWEAAEDNAVYEETAFLSYTKQGEMATVAIFLDDQQVTNVVITVGPMEEAVTETPVPQTRQDIPMLADAKLEPDSTADYIIYRTAKKMKDVGTFYQKEMPKNDWKAAKENNLAENGYLDYTKGSETATVYVTAESKGCLVEIMVSTE